MYDYSYNIANMIIINRHITILYDLSLYIYLYLYVYIYIYITIYVYNV